MDTVGLADGTALGEIDRSSCPTRSSKGYRRLTRQAVFLAAIAVFVMGAQGCASNSAQTVLPSYPGPDEYAAYGYPSDSTFSAYDPLFYAYLWPPPYYYNWYSGGDGDHDCDDGFCGPRGHGKPPHVPWRLALLPERQPQLPQAAGVISHDMSGGGSHAGGFAAHGFGGGFGGGGGHGGGHR
jgi:hypothetical protein